MILKLRASYILLAISIVILATGIILITNHFTSDITTLVDRTVVVPAGQERRFDFNVPGTGALRVTVEVISGGIINLYLYRDSKLWWTGEEGQNIIRSNFEVPIDAGSYSLVIPGSKYWWERVDSEERTVSVYIEFEG